MLILEVLIKGIPKPLHYSCGEELAKTVDIGHRATVEVGNREVSGWVVEKFSENRKKRPFELKQAIASSPAFKPRDLDLFRWVASYYGASLVEVIDCAVPPPVKRSPAASPKLPSKKSRKPLELNPAQLRASEKIAESLKESAFRPILLFGVTGSGKTEVYIEAIKTALAQGGSALILLPEIALTPQLFSYFTEALDEEMAVLHSQMANGQRWRAWDGILKRNIKVVLGARSAVFAPLPDLSLIVVDEEHEQSYKQSDGLRYSARDVAIIRAKMRGATVLLGSATPSFESLRNAQRGRYSLIEMPERATAAAMPSVEVVDLSTSSGRGMPSASLSQRLFDEISQNLERKEQSILLYNKRGFASYLQCNACAEVLLCPNCSVSLTLHGAANGNGTTKGGKLLCHICGFSSTKPPTHCQYCRNEETTRVEDGNDPQKAEERGRLVPRGAGTEKLLEELEELFPSARIARMDRDSLRKRGSHASLFKAMSKGDIDILIGTQLVAKGHDFPNVTLVGVVDADVALHLPDFRAAERNYQLLTQAAGRAGRSLKPGRVIVQSRMTKHPCIAAIARSEGEKFIDYEMKFRKAFGYPPFTRLLRLIISSEDRNRAFEEAQNLAKYLEDYATKELIFLGPAPAAYEKLRKKYRWHILVKSPSAAAIRRLSAGLFKRKTQEKKRAKDYYLAIDVDPVDMM